MVRQHHDTWKPAVAGQVINGATWVADFASRQCTRRYLFWRGADAALLAEAETLWIYIDYASGRPVRIPEELSRDFAAAEEASAGSPGRGVRGRRPANRVVSPFGAGRLSARLSPGLSGLAVCAGEAFQQAVVVGVVLLQMDGPLKTVCARVIIKRSRCIWRTRSCSSSHCSTGPPASSVLCCSSSGGRQPALLKFCTAVLRATHAAPGGATREVIKTPWAWASAMRCSAMNWMTEKVGFSHDGGRLRTGARFSRPVVCAGRASADLRARHEVFPKTALLFFFSRQGRRFGVGLIIWPVTWRAAYRACGRQADCGRLGHSINRRK